MHAIDGARCFPAEHLCLSATGRRTALSGDSAPYALRYHFAARPVPDRLYEGLASGSAGSPARINFARLARDRAARLCRGLSRLPRTNHQIGLSGSSAGATTALAAASQRHPTARAFFAQVGGSSIYDDVVYEGQSIEMERLWLWVAGNIAGLSASHREAVARQRGLNAAELAAAADSARARYMALDAARHTNPPFIESAEWMHLPLTGYPDFSVWQPYLDEILRHPEPDEFRARHNFRASIYIPGFHVTTWFDIFQTSMLAAFKHLH